MCTRNKWIAAIALVVLGLVTINAWWQISQRNQAGVAFTSEPDRIMGTTCRLVAVSADPQLAREALAAAEAELRRIEAQLSSYIDNSDLSRFNHSEAGAAKVDPALIDMLELAQTYHDRTDGAFDITVRPLIQLWREAGRSGQLPNDEQIADALAASNWSMISWSSGATSKSKATAQIDLGGIAKGWAIDRAVEVMQSMGIGAGVVDVGGDVRAFGTQPDGQPWSVAMRDPFEPTQSPFVIRLTDAAVATSGNYARFVTIEGKTYSHIIDPRTGRPADLVPSVTVIGLTAAEADVWATALSVLGPDGFGLLPSGVEAMLIVGTRDDYQMHSTEGFAAYLAPSPDAALSDSSVESSF